MTAKTAANFSIFICDPEAALHAQLVWETEHAWCEHEVELDLQRERVLNPPTEQADIDYVDLIVATDLSLVAQR